MAATRVTEQHAINGRLFYLALLHYCTSAQAAVRAPASKVHEDDSCHANAPDMLVLRATQLRAEKCGCKCVLSEQQTDLLGRLCRHQGGDGHRQKSRQRQQRQTWPAHRSAWRCSLATVLCKVIGRGDRGNHCRSRVLMTHSISRDPPAAFFHPLDSSRSSLLAWPVEPDFACQEQVAEHADAQYGQQVAFAVPHVARRRVISNSKSPISTSKSPISPERPRISGHR